MWFKLEQTSAVNSFDSPLTLRSHPTLNSISLNHQHVHQSANNSPHQPITTHKTHRQSKSKSQQNHHDLENHHLNNIKYLDSHFNQTPSKSIKSKSHHQDNITLVKSKPITIAHLNSISNSNSNSNHYHQHPMTLITPPTRPPKSVHRQSQSHYHTISSSSSLKFKSIHHQEHQYPASLKELIHHPSSNHDALPSPNHHQHRHFLTLNSMLSPSSVTRQSHYKTQSSQIINQSPSHHHPSNQVHNRNSTAFFIHPPNSKLHLTDEFLSTDEFASAEEGDESIWIAGEQDELEISSSYTSSSSSSNQSKPVSKQFKSPFLSIRENLIRPSLPLGWTSAPNINSDSHRQSKTIAARKSKSLVPTPISQHFDQIPTSTHHIQQPEPIPTPPEERLPKLRLQHQVRKSCSKEDFSAQNHRSSKLISHPVAKSLSRAFGSDFFHLNHKTDQTYQLQENRKSKPPRPHLPSSTSSYLSLKSFHTHQSPQSPNEDHDHHHHKIHRLSSIEMSKPMISSPFLTPSYSNLPLSHPRSHSSPGTILTDQHQQEEHNFGLGKRRHRQLTSDDKTSSRNSSTLYLKQLSNLFHPHSSHNNLTQNPRERLVSTISTQSIMTVQPTWKEEVAKEDYLNLLNLYGPQEMKRQEVIHELIETEKKYVSQLSKLIKLFYESEEIEHESIFKVLPIEIKMIFEELKKILKVHEVEISKKVIEKQTLLKVKENMAKDWLQIINRLKFYETYLIKFESIIKSIEELKKLDSDHRYWIGLKRIESLENDDLRFGGGEVFNGLSLTSFLLKPVQRLMKYPLFFKQLKDLTPPTHLDFHSTNILSERIDEIIKEMQNKKNQYELISKKKVLGRFEFKIDSKFNFDHHDNEDHESGKSKNMNHRRWSRRSRSRSDRRRRVSLVSEFGSEHEDDGEEDEEDENEVGEGERFKDVEVIVFDNEILIGIEVLKVTSFDERLISSGVIKVWMTTLKLAEGEIQLQSTLPILFYINQNESKERKKLKEFIKLLKIVI